MQAKLLRALQQREIKRIAGAGTIPVNIRLVAATSRDLCTTEFRRELYYRLNVVSVRTPALRDRPEDIPLLARHFIRKFGDEIGRPVRGLSPEAEAALVRYPWPGNVRQLENAIERAVVLGSTDLVVPEDLLRSYSTATTAIST
jgi:transcriptional regulator with PAS, ATPase and Fis domain